MINLFEVFNLSSYFFNWYAIPPAVVSTLILAIGLFVFLQNRTSATNRSFYLYCLTLNFWLYGIALVYCSRFAEVALWWYRWFVFLGVSHIAPAMFAFSSHWLGLYGKQNRFIWASFIIAPIFYLVAVLTPYGMPYVNKYFWGYYPAYGIGGILFLLFFLGYFAAAFFNLICGLKIQKDPLRKKQVQMITLAYAICFVASSDYLPKLILLNLYPTGFAWVFIWTSITAYSIVKYKVMDIETVIHRTVLWMVISSIVVLPVVGIFYVLKNWYQNTNTYTFSLFISALFFVFFLYLKKVQPHIDHLFKRRELDLERTLIKFNDALVHLKDLTELSNYIIQTVCDVLYVDKVQIFLKSSRDQSLIRIDTDQNKESKISLGNKFIQWLERKDNVALREFIDIDPRFDQIRSEAKAFFEQMDIQVVIPLVLNRELIGLINLGRKASFKSFRAPEITFLSDLRRAATIALSNSLRLIEMQESLRKWNEDLEEKVKQRTHELEEAQKQLIQAEKLVTLGTLAGGVAHEINNPLTAILTNAQMLKTIELDQDSLESASLIEEGAKRCQSIVQKLMKYARKPLGNEKQQEVDLNQVIENTLSFIGYQFEQENVQLVKRLNEVSKINGLANELEQVFMNLLLNAKDAVRAAKSRGLIEIKTFEQNGSVCASVSDDGIGISKSHVSKIFDPFFTTKEVGKGTGLGLSIIYGIVEKHGGKIEVASTEGKGSTFTVFFPK